MSYKNADKPKDIFMNILKMAKLETLRLSPGIKEFLDAIPILTKNISKFEKIDRILINLADLKNQMENIKRDLRNLTEKISNKKEEPNNQRQQNQNQNQHNHKQHFYKKYEHKKSFNNNDNFRKDDYKKVEPIKEYDKKPESAGFIIDELGNKVPTKPQAEKKPFNNPNPKPFQARRCKVWGCEKPAFDMGYCAEHYEKFYLPKTQTPQQPVGAKKVEAPNEVENIKTETKITDPKTAAKKTVTKKTTAKKTATKKVVAKTTSAKKPAAKKATTKKITKKK
ncbi:MAG: hypothetical protein ABIA04_15760 [Pseudomonadota bacterium]